MTCVSYRALALGTALALVWTAGIAAAQTVADETQEAAVEEAGEAAPASSGEVTLLPQIDVGATAEGTAGTNIISISQDEMERKKPATLREVFTGEPQIAVGGSIPSTQKIYVNGVDETNLAVTVDGSRQNNKVFHHNGTYLLDPALLKAVTVQPGVAPADAGPAALAGSMGFETKDAIDLLEPGRSFGGFVTGAYDTNSQTYMAGASAFGMKDGFEYLGYLNYSRGDNYTSGDGEEMLGTGTDLISGLGKIAYESVGGHRFELSHERVRDDELRPYRANFYFNHGLEPEVRNYDIQRQNTVFTYTQTAAEGWFDPKVVLAYSRTGIGATYTDRFTGAESDGFGATRSFNGKVENKFSFDIGSVTAGFDFYNDRATYESPEYDTAERASNIGAYAQARLDPFDRARISFGARADHQWFTGVDDTEFRNSGVSGNVSGEYDLTDFFTVKAGASRVWGAIPLAENYVQNPVWDYGNGPEPVTSRNLTAGFEARFNGFTFEGNVFRTDISDARAAVFRSALNNFDLMTQGWEIGARYDWDNAFVSVKYADIDAEVDGYYPDSYIGNYLTTPLGQIFMIGAGYTFHDWGLRVGGDVEIALKNTDTLAKHPSDPITEKVAIDSYEVVNAFVEYTPPSHSNFTFRADVRNIFDEQYSNRASYGQDYFGEKPHSEPGRSFRFSATMRF